MNLKEFVRVLFPIRKKWNKPNVYCNEKKVYLNIRGYPKFIEWGDIEDIKIYPRSSLNLITIKPRPNSRVSLDFKKIYILANFVSRKKIKEEFERQKREYLP